MDIAANYNHFWVWQQCLNQSHQWGPIGNIYLLCKFEIQQSLTWLNWSLILEIWPFALELEFSFFNLVFHKFIFDQQSKYHMHGSKQNQSIYYYYYFCTNTNKVILAWAFELKLFACDFLVTVLLCDLNDNHWTLV